MAAGCDAEGVVAEAICRSRFRLVRGRLLLRNSVAAGLRTTLRHYAITCLGSRRRRLNVVEPGSPAGSTPR